MFDFTKPKNENDNHYAIEVHNVSKHFKVPHQKRDTVYENIIGLFEGKRYGYEEFTALHDVSFNVKHGEILGIIGENGSGKSTLLKIIAGVLSPDEGSVKVGGKIAPFLELGVGFQPELSAEENIFLYGSIMGMKKSEMNEKIEDIFEFAELKNFRNAKLKNFSSGMYARLAFATAFATEPDIYLIDEVLAVGDEAFQRKCMDKIDEIKSTNRTIIFISHDMAAIKRLCKRAIFLEDGHIRFTGNTEKVIYSYHSYINEKEMRKFKKSIAKDSPHMEAIIPFDENIPEMENRAEEMQKDRWGTKEIEIVEVKLLDKDDDENSIFNTNDMMKIKMHYKINTNYEEPTFGVGIFSNDGTYITGVHIECNEISPALNDREGTISLVFDELPLLTGLYKITVGVCSDNKWNKPYDVRSQHFIFKIQSSKKHDGFVDFRHNWEIA